jgi:hypothetical protein
MRTTITRLSVILTAILALSGCETTQAVPVQEVSIKAETFCETMFRVLPASPTRQRGKPRWDVTNRRETIDDARRIGAAVDRNCTPNTLASPTQPRRK